MRALLIALALLASGCATAQQIAVPALCSACATVQAAGLCGSTREVQRVQCPAGQVLYVTNLRDVEKHGEAPRLKCKDR